MSIRSRLILVFFICLMLACGSISVVVFLSAEKSARAAFSALAVSQLERVEERINTFLEPGSMSIQYLAGLEVVRNSRGNLSSYLRTDEVRTLLYADHTPHERLIYDEFIRMSQSNTNYGLVFMANNDGQYAQVPEGRIKPPRYDPRMRSWYIEAMQSDQEVTVTSPYRTTGGGMVCSIMVKTYDMQGKPLGLLGVDYSLQGLTRDLDNRQILETGYLVVFDANGRIVVDGRHSEYTALEPNQYPELHKRAATTPDGLFYGKGTQGSEEFVVTRTMDATGWKLAVIFQESELMKSSYSLLKTILLTSGIIFALSFVLAHILARTIVHPIEELIEASSIIASGEYESSESVHETLRRKLHVNDQGEAGKLSQALDRMFHTLQERIKIAENATRAKSAFLSNMSHEMRTPMNAIIGMTAIARSTSDTEKKAYCLACIDEASKHLLGVINDILDISRIEANKLELSLTEFHLAEMLQKAIRIVSPLMEEKQQRFIFHIDEKIPNTLVGDDQRLAQVIANLLGNATKFTPKYGSITLNAFLLEEIDGFCTLQVEVSDTGIGIDQEQQSRIFTSFEQAESGTSRKFGGTGLGLAISERIVGMMQGKIWIDSDLGKGTTVHFIVKLERGGGSLGDTAEPNAGSEEDSAARAESFAGYCVLLAEDVAINREIVLSLLEPTALQIEVAENGAEAVKMFEENPERYDMIFMDVQMPEMDGCEATRRIRSMNIPKAKEIPIIAMTANVFREDIENYLAIGMNAHIGKPLVFEDILVKLHTYLGKGNIPCPQE